MTRFLSSLALAAVLTAAPGALQLSAAQANGNGNGNSSANSTPESYDGGMSTQRACSNCW